jgi:hypothetical protein
MFAQPVKSVLTKWLFFGAAAALSVVINRLCGRCLNGKCLLLARNGPDSP